MGSLHSACNFCVSANDDKDQKMDKYRLNNSCSSVTLTAASTAIDFKAKDECSRSLDPEGKCDLKEEAEYGDDAEASESPSSTISHSEHSAASTSFNPVIPPAVVTNAPLVTLPGDGANPLPHDLLSPVLPMLTTRSSKDVIKKTVLQTYDVDDESLNDHGHDFDASSSADSMDRNDRPRSKLDVVRSVNLYRDQTNTEWTTDAVLALENDMSLELECLRQNSYKRRPPEVTPKTAGTQSDSSSCSGATSGSNSGAHSRSSSSTSSVSQHLTANPQSLFRETSDGKWDVEDMEATKSEMAKHMVHLHHDQKLKMMAKE